MLQEPKMLSSVNIYSHVINKRVNLILFLYKIVIYFVVVRKATAVLLDKDKRREYDELGSSLRGFSNVKFDLSGNIFFTITFRHPLACYKNKYTIIIFYFVEEAVEAILIAAGIAGIAVGIVALCEWLFTEPKKEDNSKPKNS